jgi:hypothetical protein
MGDQPVASPLPTHRTIKIIKAHTDIHVSTRIRTHDLSVRATENDSWLRPRGQCDRPLTVLPVIISQEIDLFIATVM